MAAKTTTATDVEIFGAVYHVRGEKDPEYLQELASLVDQRMQDVARQVTTVDSAKIAILAALNIADELCQCRKRQQGEQGEIEEKVAALTSDLQAALEG